MTVRACGQSRLVGLPGRDHRCLLGCLMLRGGVRWPRRSCSHVNGIVRVVGVPGDPSTAAAIRKLVIRIATDNPAWGHRRVFGALVKLGHRIAPFAVRQILCDAGIGPAPPAAAARPGSSSDSTGPVASSQSISSMWIRCCPVVSTL
jgi:hypothetical protein